MADSILNFKDTKYIINGLTTVSNNDSVNPRDTAGNIILDGDSSILTIEAIAYGIINTSVLPLIDTQFRYFKFPAVISNVNDPINLDTNLDLDIQLVDPVFARYAPSADSRIVESNTYSGILMDDVKDGSLQQITNAYYITKELKNSGVDLRFRINLQHRYDATSGYGTAYFSIINSNINGINREYRTYANTSELHPTVPGSINQYEVQNLIIDIIIPNSEFDISDTFSIGAKSGQNNNTQYHTINSIQSYWVISDASKNVDLWNREINQEVPVVANQINLPRENI
jgi:hypothetical protein